MRPEFILELVGYFASALVLVSLLMTSVVKLRILNGVGALIFAIYALLIHSYPTAVMNFCLVVIDLWFLVKVLKTRTLFSVQPCRLDEGAVQHFLRFYQGDIQALFPGLDPSALSGGACFLVYADAAPVGILVGDQSDNTITVALDYSVPSHRDCSVGKFLYGHLPSFGVTELRSLPGTDHHNQYLRTMGFSEQNGTYIRRLP